MAPVSFILSKVGRISWATTGPARTTRSALAASRDLMVTRDAITIWPGSRNVTEGRLEPNEARRDGAPAARAPSLISRLDAAPHAVVHVVPHPLPEAILGRQVGVRLHLGAPALHDVVLDGPEAHAIALHQLAPVVADLRARVDQTDGDVLREVVERTQVDPLIGGGRPRLDRPIGHVGNAVADHHDGDRRQHEVPLLHVARDLLEEDVEVGERRGGRNPFPETALDLVAVFVVERVDGVEGFGLVVALPADRGDEEIARLGEPAELVHVTVEVVGDEREGIVVGRSERSARVETDEQRRPWRLAVLRLRRRDHNGDAEQRGRDQASNERTGQAPHSVAGFLGGVCTCRFCSMCQVWVISLPSLKGSEKTWREETRTIPKLIAAAASCSTGSTR